MAYIGKTPTVGNFVKLDAITASATASYTMQLDSVNFSPESVNHMLVSLNGVIQAPTDSYTISGSTITFASALTSSDSIDFIMVYGNVLDIGTPSDNTVSLAKLTATGTKDATTFLRGDNTFATASLTGVTTGSGNVTISNGNLVLGTSGKGIDFSATSDGTTMSSELLNDYEEGTFTPTWASQGGSVTGSSAVTGSYIKIGKQVTVNATGILTTNSASTNYKFSNAPFQANGDFTGVGHEYGQTGTSQLVWIDDNSSQINLKKYDGAMIQNPYLRLTITYFTD